MHLRDIAQRLRLVLIMAALALFTAQAGADNGATSFTLDNGLQVVVIPDRRAPVVTHMVWYKVGSADEEAGRSGIAHFLEHLMFKGTEKYAAGEFSAAISAIGGNENAFTSRDFTAYYQQVGTDALPEMMEFEADRMRGLVLTEEVIAPERDVVLEERRSRVENSPGSLLSEEVEATLFQNHPYRIPVIGWMHEIVNLDREQALEFYDLHYAPNNAILVVTGDVAPEEVKSLAEATYGKVPRGPDLPPRLRPQEPRQDTARTVSLSDPRVGVPSMQRSWVVPSYTSAEPGEAEALDLLAEILGGGVRSRLYQELVVKNGIAASAGAGYRATALDDTSFSVYAAPRGGNDLAAAEDAVEAEIARLVEEGVSDDELRRAKNRFLRGMIFARDNQTGMARIYGSLLATGLGIEDIEAWPDRVRAVTADDVRNAARRYLTADAHVTGYLLPQDGGDQ
ncbi:MAG: pitrilysin family protein [Rhizobiaceae bacterium]